MPMKTFAIHFKASMKFKLLGNEIRNQNVRVKFILKHQK